MHSSHTHNSRVRNFFCFAIILALAASLSAVADEIGGLGSRQVVVSGEFTHSRAQNVAVTGAPEDNQAAFHQEIYGQEFTVSVPGLDSGTYSVVIGLVENHFDHPGERVFNITSGRQTIARRLDIFAAAGGKGKVLFLTNQVQFASDATPGPFSVKFSALQNEAKLNTFELRDASGHSLVAVNAADFVPRSEDPAALKIPDVRGPEIWRDPSQPFDARVQDLVSRLSLVEKVSELSCDAPAIPCLGIPAYSYRNEGLHGVAAHSGYATVFPQAIGLAATWDTALEHSEGDVIATEARAIHNDYAAKHNGDSLIHMGLNFYSPNINIFRDPRWGRGQETYGEDPFLTGQTAIAFITGMQGDDPKYFKTIACAKHYAVHSGPESERHRFNAEPPERDLYETYLPAFEAAVRVGHVNSVMGAYSALYGIPDCANAFLLTDVLRKQWGFDGFVVSDGGAIFDINNHHKYVPTAEEAAADAVKAGDDMCSGGGKEYSALTRAVKLGLISEAEIDTALGRSLKARFQLGLFDPANSVPYAQIPLSENDTPGHAALALQVARESVVLLKNHGFFHDPLPLDRTRLHRIAVIGANADSVPVLLGNYHGQPSRTVTILDGIRQAAGTNITITYDSGCPLATHTNQPTSGGQKWDDAIADAATADVIIYVGGISSQLEGEEMKVNFDGFDSGDRTRIELPAVQVNLLKALSATGKPVVFVDCSGSAIAMPWAVKKLPAIVQVWYPGEEGGRAVADVLFGNFNPSGKLPVTFYGSTSDLPSFEDYSMTNRTYRYYTGHPEYAFGHGLSYTKFSYHAASLDRPALTAKDTAQVSFSVKNTGSLAGDEVAQVYFRHVDSTEPQPRLALCGFARVHLEPHQATRVTISIPAERFRYWDTTRKQYVVEPGRYQLLIGSASDDIRLKKSFTIVP
jgi:beta-glucosidase